MAHEARYIVVLDNGVVYVYDTLHDRAEWDSLDGVESIWLTRSELEVLKEKVDKALSRP